MVTPLRPMELMLGKTMPFAVVGLVDVTLVTTLALVLFHVPFNGSFPVAVVLLAVVPDDLAGCGLFISTHIATRSSRP